MSFLSQILFSSSFIYFSFFRELSVLLSYGRFLQSFFFISDQFLLSSPLSPPDVGSSILQIN